MWEVGRKIRPEGHCLASWGLPECDFLPTPYTHDRFFFLHTFWTWIFNNTVTLDADVSHIVMTLPWRLVMPTLMMANVMYYTTSVYQIWEFLIFILTWVGYPG